jgi:excisionase family DNA binding protein
MLNAKHLRTARGNSFTSGRVGHVRRGLGLPAAKPSSLCDNNDPTWMSVGTAAQVLGVSPDTIRRWAREGSLEANQVMTQAPWRIHVTDDVIARMVPGAQPGWVGLNAAAKALGRSKQVILGPECSAWGPSCNLRKNNGYRKWSAKAGTPAKRGRLERGRRQ